jgi:hypothetical protein
MQHSPGINYFSGSAIPFIHSCRRKNILPIIPNGTVKIRKNVLPNTVNFV